MSPDDVMCDGPADSADRTWSDRGGYVRGFEDMFDPTRLRHPRRRDPAPSIRSSSGRCTPLARRCATPGTPIGTPARSVPCSATCRSRRRAWPRSRRPSSIRASRVRGRDRASDRLTRATASRPVCPRCCSSVASRLGAGAIALDAACASSLYAIKLACDRLHDGTADLMLAGAVNCADDLFIHLGLHRAAGAQPNRSVAAVPPRRRRARARRGMRLRRAAAAGRRGRATATRSTASSAASACRTTAGAAACSCRRPPVRCARCARRSTSPGCRAADISLLECHATGTQAGDATEVRSASEVYGELRRTCRSDRSSPTSAT